MPAKPLHADRISCHKCKRMYALATYDKLPSQARNPFCPSCVARKRRVMVARMDKRAAGVAS